MMKFRHLVGILYYGIGKLPKKHVFAKLDQNNCMEAKFDLAYHVGNFDVILYIFCLFPLQI